MAGSTIKIPEDLMARLEQEAAIENLSPEKLVHVAVEEHLRNKRRKSLYDRAEQRTRSLGIPESQVDAIVREERDRVKLGR